MREQGHVVYVSPSYGMLVVRHSGGFALVEMLGDEGSIEVGDSVSGRWDALGGEPIFKSEEAYDAYFQGNWGTKEAAIKVANS